jgi:hypothetical protein
LRFNFAAFYKGYFLTKTLFGKAIINATNRRKNVVFANEMGLVGGLLTLRG